MIVSLYWVQYCGSDPMSRYSSYSRYSNTTSKMVLMITKKLYGSEGWVATFALKTTSSGIQIWRQGCRQPRRSSARSELRRRYLMLSQTLSTLFFAIASIKEHFCTHLHATVPNCDKKKFKKGPKGVERTWNYWRLINKIS